MLLLAIGLEYHILYAGDDCRRHVSVMQRVLISLHRRDGSASPIALVPIRSLARQHDVAGQAPLAALCGHRFRCVARGLHELNEWRIIMAAKAR